MLSKSLLLTLVAFPSIAMAEPAPWGIAYEKRESASSKAGFLELVRNNPELFRGFDPLGVLSANVHVILFEYKGASSCPAGDRRLLVEEKAFGVCGSDGACFQIAIPYPDPKDPCSI